MEYMDVKTAAERWEFTEQKITRLCREGRICGVIKEDGLWMIPENAQKPTDGRKMKGAHLKKHEPLLPLPIGVSNFRELVLNYYYVDKTLFIRDFWDKRPQVSLFTRPRRFGKTLMMDMLKTFFEISAEDTSVYFKDKKIWQCGERYRKEQGTYPVISVSFKDIKFSSWEETFRGICDVIAKEYNRHSYLMDSEKVSGYYRKYFQGVLERTVTEVGMSASLSNLSEMLHAHYGKASIIIVDEYDTPIQQGYMNEYYDRSAGFLRNLFSAAFKDNHHLAYGFLTGILRVSKESIFSGLNNLKVHSVLEERYSEYFGFTDEDVKEMLRYYSREEKADEICDWYDGYCFGSTDIFNPWSVLNYLDEKCTPKAYWQSTGDNSIIRQVVAEADDETTENLHKLMQGEAVSSYIDTSVIYPEIKKNPTTIYSFLLSAGYLKIVVKNERPDDTAICNVAIPNKEIIYVYEHEILSALSEVLPQSTAIGIRQAIMTQDVPKLQEHLQKLLIQTISSFDDANETFYHGLMLGICAIMNNSYYVDSNRESGYGRYDIQMRPIRDKNLPGIIIELKVVREKLPEDSMETELEKSANAALEQIDKKQYVTMMKREGITAFLKIGMSFHKKQVKINSRMEK